MNPPAEAGPPAKPDPQAASLRPIAVVADDVKANRTLVANWIQRLGYTCRTAGDGKQAWQLLTEYRAALVVTDIDMPVYSGLTLLHSLRNHASPALRKLPVIVMSSLRDAEIYAIVAHFGGTFFLPKPLDRAAFDRAVASIAQRPAAGRTAPDPPAAAPPRPAGARAATRVSPTLRRLVQQVRHEGPLLR